MTHRTTTYAFWVYSGLPNLSTYSCLKGKKKKVTPFSLIECNVITYFGINYDICPVLYLFSCVITTVQSELYSFGQKGARHCFVFFSSVLQEQQRAEPETGQLCPVGIQVSLGLTFEFSEGVVYFHIALCYSLKYIVTCIYLRKRWFKRTKYAEICNDPQFPNDFFPNPQTLPGKVRECCIVQRSKSSTQRFRTSFSQPWPESPSILVNY